MADATPHDADARSGAGADADADDGGWVTVSKTKSYRANKHDVDALHRTSRHSRASPMTALSHSVLTSEDDLKKRYDNTPRIPVGKDASEVPDSWPSWPLTCIVYLTGLASALPESLIARIRAKAASGEMPIPAMDMLPGAEIQCHGILEKLACKALYSSSSADAKSVVEVISSFAQILQTCEGTEWLDKINKFAIQAVLFVRSEYWTSPAVFATESVRFDGHLAGRDHSSLELWKKKPESAFNSCAANSKTRSVTVSALNREMFYKGGRMPYDKPEIYLALLKYEAPERILDCFAGFGDRLSAAMCAPSVKHYTGVDCWKDLQPGYSRIIRGARKIHKHPGNYRVLAQSFEDCSAAEFERLKEWGPYEFVSVVPPTKHEIYQCSASLAEKADQALVKYPDDETFYGVFWPRVIRQILRLAKNYATVMLDMGTSPWEETEKVLAVFKSPEFEKTVKLNKILAVKRTERAPARPYFFFQVFLPESAEQNAWVEKEPFEDVRADW